MVEQGRRSGAAGRKTLTIVHRARDHPGRRATLLGVNGWGWTVLTLLFVVEVVAWAAYGVWGWQHDPRWLLVWLLPLAVVTVWGTCASPKARYGGRVVTPVVKVAVFAGATLALYDGAGLGWAAGFLVVTVVLHALARLPAVRELHEGRDGFEARR
jgi:hypothetical protein